MPTKSYKCIYITILPFCIRVLVGPPLSLVVAAVVAVATVAVAGDIAVQDGFESRFPHNLDLPGNISCEADMTCPVQAQAFRRSREENGGDEAAP